MTAVVVVDWSGRPPNQVVPNFGGGYAGQAEAAAGRILAGKLRIE